MRVVLRALLWTGIALAALIAGAARWADAGSFAAVLPTQRVAVVAGAAFALVVCCALAPRWRKAWPLMAAAAALAALNAAPFSWHYRTQYIAFASSGATLRGAIYAPAGEPVAALVFIHGSGPETRREFAYHARALARDGVVALAYDKRGAGASDGSGAVHYRQFAEDAAAALRALRTRYPKLRAGYYGHSEGAWVAPIAAALEAPAFIIISGATPDTPAEQVLYQSVNDVRAGFGDATAERVRRLQEAALAYQRTGQAPPELAVQLRAAAGEPWFDDSDLPDQLYPHADYAWWTSVMDFDAEPYWRRVDAPVLGLWGAADNRSDAAASRALFQALLGDRFRGMIYPGADHMVLTWPIGTGTPPPAFPDTFVADIVAWIEAG